MSSDKTTLCPDCEHEIELGIAPELGQKITCPNCWAYLEVINLEPLELAWEAFEEEDNFDNESEKGGNQDCESCTAG